MSKSDIVQFIRDRNFLNKNMSQEKIVTNIDDMSLEFSLNEIERNTPYTSGMQNSRVIYVLFIEICLIFDTNKMTNKHFRFNPLATRQFLKMEQ